MANTVVQDIVVEKLTKYGFADGKGYVSFSKKFTDQAQIVPGASFEGEVYTSEGGTRYLNKIVKTNGLPHEEKKAREHAPAVTAPPAPKKAPASEVMSKADWSAKDRSQLIGGLSHDAAVLVAAMMQTGTVEDPVATFSTTLKGLLEVRDGMK